MQLKVRSPLLSLPICYCMPVKQDIILRLERQFVYFTSTFGEEYTVAPYCHILRITAMHRIIAIHINLKAHRTTRAKCSLSGWKQKWCVHWINSYSILNLKNKIQIDSWSKWEKDCQFSWLPSCVWLFVTPWIASHQAFLSITNSWKLAKLMSIESVMPPNHHILCSPLLLLPSVFPSIRIFANESGLRIRWPKYWSFSFSISLKRIIVKSQGLCPWTALPPSLVIVWLTWRYPGHFPVYSFELWQLGFCTSSEEQRTERKETLAQKCLDLKLGGHNSYTKPVMGLCGQWHPEQCS